jgi:hypothetical protein
MIEMIGDIRYKDKHTQKPGKHIYVQIEAFMQFRETFPILLVRSP